MTEMDGVVELERVADKEYQGHRRVTSRLREIMTAQRVVFAHFQLIMPFFYVPVTLSAFYANEIGSSGIGTIEREVILVVQTVVEEAERVAYAEHAERGVVVYTRHAHGSL